MAHLRFIMRAAKFAYTFALFRDWTEVVGFTASLQITTQLTLIFSVYCEIVYDAFVERTVRINFSEKQNPAAVFRKNKIREAEKPQSCQKSDFILTSSKSVPLHDEK